MYGTSGGKGALAGTGAGFVVMGYQVTLGLVLVLMMVLIITGAMAYRLANKKRRYVA